MRMPVPEAISYSRYSNPGQWRTESLARQDEENTAIAAALGLPLNLTLTDRGLSAYTGMNRLKGAFASLLLRLERGLIAPGSVLIVESLDRISRENVNDALMQFLSIVNRGLAIYTKRDKTHYSAATLRSREGLRLLFASIMEMIRANEESENKGGLVRFTKAKRRQAAAQDGTIATGVGPGWLEVVRDAKGRKVGWRPIHHRVEVVRRMFCECIGGVGVNTIARRLTEEWKAGNEASAPWGKGRRGEDGRRGEHAWHGATVHSILVNRAVLGEWQPTQRNKTTAGKVVPAGDPILGYYGEAIIDLPTFQKAAHALARNRSVENGRAMGGRRGSTFPNLFLGIASCAACCGRMAYRYAGRPLIVCDSYRRGGGCRVNTHYRVLDIERAVLDAFEDRLFDKGSLVAPNDRAAQTEAELAAVQEEANFLTKRIGEIMRDRTRDYDSIRDILDEMQRDKGAALERLKSLAKRLGEERGGEGPGEHIRAVRRLRAMAVSAAEGKERYDARARINAALREVVGDMVCHSEGPSVTLNLRFGIGHAHIAKVGGPAAVVVNPPELQAAIRDLASAHLGAAGARDVDALVSRAGAPTHPMAATRAATRAAARKPGRAA